MFLKLRILFTILSALCLATALTAGAIWGWTWTIILGLGALLFFISMLYFKRAQEAQEEKEKEERKFFTSAQNVSPDKQDNQNDNQNTPFNE